MTETVVLQRKTVSATGFANPLNLPANAEANSHIKVYGDDTELTLGVDYTLEGVGDTGDLDEIAGVNALIESDTLLADLYDTYTIEHVPPLDQEADLASGGTLGRIYENALDALGRRLQSLGAQVDRRLVLPVDDSVASPILPPPEARRALTWNEAGTALINSFTDPDTAPVAEALTQLEDAQAALVVMVDEAEAAQVAAELARDAAQAAQAAAEAAAAAAGDPEAIAAMGVPVGATMLFAHTSYPTSAFLKENGAAVSRTTYADLFAVIGTTYGVGDGSTTFNLPESRGEFIRGLDDSRGVDTGRALGAAQSAMVGPHGHTATAASAGSHSHTITRPVRRGANGDHTPGWDGGDVLLKSSKSYSTSTGGAHSHTITVNNSTGTENRPRNVARLFCIKFAVYTPPE